MHTLVRYLTMASMRPESLLLATTELSSRRRRVWAGRLCRVWARAVAPRTLYDSDSVFRCLASEPGASTCQPHTATTPSPATALTSLLGMPSSRMFCAQINCLGSWLGSGWARSLRHDGMPRCLSQALGLDVHASPAALGPDPSPVLLSALSLMS